MKNETPIADTETATFNTEAVRSFMFNQALQVAEGMKEQGAENADAVLLTGSLEFAVQLWVQVSLRAGVLPEHAWATLASEVEAMFHKHVVAELGLHQLEPLSKRAS